jgi:2-oxoglutarate dehydrogenase E2 component (dihydrolipoamide succinyltransferase)
MLRPTANKLRAVRTLTQSVVAKSNTTVSGAITQQRSIRFLNAPKSINPHKIGINAHQYRTTQPKVQKRFYADEKEVTVRVPEMGDSITEGTVLKWLLNVGDSFKEDDVVCQIETDKVTADVRAPQAGTLTQQCAKEKDTVTVGSDLFKFTAGAGAKVPSAKQESPKATPAETKPAEPAKKVESKPEPPKQQQEAPKPQPPKQQAPAPSAPSAGGQRGERRVPLSRMRLKIAERLKDAQNTYAMLTTFNELDMSGIMALREKYKDAFQEKHGVKLGFMSAFVVATAQALKEFPIVNAVIDGTDILYRDYVDISVAVSTPNGLVVPVLRDCDQMKYADVEKKIGELGEKARKNQLTLPEMQGGTFTISNGGVFGSLFGTPILNPPQSAILGMHATVKRPVAVNDQVVVRPMMYIALTYDHRIIDGREAVLFLKRVKALVEDPAQLLLV